MYKTEKYLDKCVSSIVNQTYRNLEIILVDDGSPDNCPAMCDEWARRDSRIKVIHKENGGQDTAHNAALDIASGEFIAMVDNDDYIAPNMYEKLYAVLTENNADISMCNILTINEEGNEVNHPWFMPLNEAVFTREQMFNKYLDGTLVPLHWALWNKLYKSEIFRELRFKGGVYDDIGTIHRTIGNCKTIAVSSEKLYFYLRRSDSVTGKVLQEGFVYKVFKGSLEGLQDRYEYFMSIGRPDLAHTATYGFQRLIKSTLKQVNYFQLKDDLKDIVPDTISKLLHSGIFRDKLRAVKLALIWLRSIFRLFIDKEKLS